MNIKKIFQIFYVIALVTVFSCRFGVREDEDEDTEDLIIIPGTSFISNSNLYTYSSAKIGHEVPLTVYLRAEKSKKYFSSSGVGLFNPDSGARYSAKWRISLQGSSSNLIVTGSAASDKFTQLLFDGTAAANATAKSLLFFEAGNAIKNEVYDVYLDVLDKAGGSVIDSYKRSIEVVANLSPKELTFERAALSGSAGSASVSNREGSKTQELGSFTVSNNNLDVPFSNSKTKNVLFIEGFKLADDVKIVASSWSLGSKVKFYGKDSNAEITDITDKNRSTLQVNLDGNYLHFLDTPNGSADFSAALTVQDQYGQSFSLTLKFS